MAYYRDIQRQQEHQERALKAPMDLLGLQRQGLIPAPEPDLDVFMLFEDGTAAQDVEEGIDYESL